MPSMQETLYSLIYPVVEALDFEFWGLEYLTQRTQAKLCIYIEKNPEGNVCLNDCERVSRQVASLLDVEDPITSHYILEVSSPGIDRRLFTLAHYQRSIGKKVIARLTKKFEERRKITGVIVAVENNEIVLQADDEEYFLPVELIEKVNIIPTF